MGGVDQAIERSKGGLTTKIHAVVDALGNSLVSRLPLVISLTAGNVHDIKQAEVLLAQVEPKALLADKGYDADNFIETLKKRQIHAVIPPKSNRIIQRDCDYTPYRERNLVEKFFQFIKQYCAIATRYEKTARNFLACKPHLRPCVA